jgi:ubiquinone/menaquinone biosynthesis C-methylase UbiE
MSTVVKDFDRLAVLDSEGWTHNNHYHDFLLRHVPERCSSALDVGCGTGAFSRRLAEKAERVVALDLSPEMIRVARSRAAGISNIEFACADVMTFDLPPDQFDCVASVATLHHLPLRQVLLKLRETIKPGGVLLVLDLFKPAGLIDALLNLIAMGTSVSLRFVHNGRLRPPREVRAAWEEHGKTDTYPTMREVRSLYDEIFPGAQIRQHLLWRYSIVWRKE